MSQVLVNCDNGFPLLCSSFSFDFSLVFYVFPFFMGFFFFCYVLLFLKLFLFVFCLCVFSSFFFLQSWSGRVKRQKKRFWDKKEYL